VNIPVNLDEYVQEVAVELLNKRFADLPEQLDLPKLFVQHAGQDPVWLNYFVQLYDAQKQTAEEIVELAYTKYFDEFQDDMLDYLREADLEHRLLLSQLARGECKELPVPFTGKRICKHFFKHYIEKVNSENDKEQLHGFVESLYSETVAKVLTPTGHVNEAAVEQIRTDPLSSKKFDKMMSNTV